MIKRNEMIKLYQMLCESRFAQEMLEEKHLGNYYDIGEEAINVGCIAAIKDNDYINQYFRGAGTALQYKGGFSLEEIFAMWMQKKQNRGYANACLPALHVFTNKVVGYIDSCLGVVEDTCCGVALAQKYNKTNNIMLVLTGDGTTNKGNFHEVLTFASLKKLPYLCVVRSNGWAMSTPSAKGVPQKNIADMAQSYGIPSAVMDGNDVISVYEEVKKAADWVRDNGPMLIEAKTYRLSGHSANDEYEYGDPQIIKQWSKKDPVLVMEKYLKQNDFETEEIALIKNQVKLDVVDAFKVASDLPALDMEEVLKNQQDVVGKMWRVKEV